MDFDSYQKQLRARTETEKTRRLGFVGVMTIDDAMRVMKNQRPGEYIVGRGAPNQDDWWGHEGWYLVAKPIDNSNIIVKLLTVHIGTTSSPDKITVDYPDQHTDIAYGGIDERMIITFERSTKKYNNFEEFLRRIPEILPRGEYRPYYPIPSLQSLAAGTVKNKRLARNRLSNIVRMKHFGNAKISSRVITDVQEGRYLNYSEPMDVSNTESL